MVGIRVELQRVHDLREAIGLRVVPERLIVFGLLQGELHAERVIFREFRIQLQLPEDLVIDLAGPDLADPVAAVIVHGHGVLGDGPGGEERIGPRAGSEEDRAGRVARDREPDRRGIVRPGLPARGIVDRDAGNRDHGFGAALVEADVPDQGLHIFVFHDPGKRILGFFRRGDTDLQAAPRPNDRIAVVDIVPGGRFLPEGRIAHARLDPVRIPFHAEEGDVVFSVRDLRAPVLPADHILVKTEVLAPADGDAGIVAGVLECLIFQRGEGDGPESLRIREGHAFAVVRRLLRQIQRHADRDRAVGILIRVVGRRRLGLRFRRRFRLRRCCCLRGSLCGLLRLLRTAAGRHRYGRRESQQDREQFPSSHFLSSLFYYWVKKRYPECFALFRVRCAGCLRPRCARDSLCAPALLISLYHESLMRCDAFGVTIPDGCRPEYRSKRKGPKRRGRPRKPLTEREV